MTETDSGSGPSYSRNLILYNKNILWDGEALC